MVYTWRLSKVGEFSLLKEQIATDMKAAMKEKNRDKTSILRMLLSEIKYAQAAVSMSSELPEGDVLKVVSTYYKRLEKSLADYPEGEQRVKIQAEMVIVDAYLPQKVSEAEVAKAVDDILSSTEERQFGHLMKQLMNQFGASADGKLISRLLKEKLDS